MAFGLNFIGAAMAGKQSSAAMDLGLGGGNLLQQQRKDKEDELRKKRQMELQRGKTVGPSGVPLSPAFMSLYGNQY